MIHPLAPNFFRHFAKVPLKNPEGILVEKARLGKKCKPDNSSKQVFLSFRQSGVEPDRFLLPIEAVIIGSHICVLETGAK